MLMIQFKQSLKTCLGIALIQVLFLSTILALIALHFTLTGRYQIDVAKAMQDKASAELLLKSWESELIFALSTYPTTGVGEEFAKANLLSGVWNFHGAPFSPQENVTMKIQDVYGLLSLASTGSQAELRTMLSMLGFASSDVGKIVSSLNKLRGDERLIYQPSGSAAGRNMFLQDLSELRVIANISESQFSLLTSSITHLPNNIFNPLTAPDFRLKAKLPGDVASRLIELRNSNLLDITSYLSAVNSSNFEEESFVPGQRFVVEISARQGLAMVKKRFICYIRPENKFPIIWLD